MKKINFATLSAESLSEEDTIHPDLLATVAEDSEAGEDISDMDLALEEMSNEIVEELDINNRTYDVSDNLSDIADTLEASQNTEITDVEKSLVASSINMAVAGTDEDAAEIAPAMESFQDKALLVSSLRAKYNIAGESIMESLKGLFSKIGDFIKGLFSFTTKIENRLKYVKSKISELSKSEVKEITLNFKKTTYLKKDISEYVSDFSEYKNVLKETNVFFAAFAPLAVKSVTDFNSSFWDYVKTLGRSEATFDEALKLYNAYIDSFVKSTVSLPGMVKRSTKLSYIDEYNSKALLGGFHVSAIKFNRHVIPSMDNIPDMKNNITNSRVMFFRYTPILGHNLEKTKNFIEMTANLQDLKDIVTETEKALSVFKLFLNKAYKTTKLEFLIPGAGIEINGKLMSLHTLILNRGLLNTIIYTSTSREYAKLLCDKPLAVVEKFVYSSKWNTAK